MFLQETAERLPLRLAALSVYRGVGERPVTSALIALWQAIAAENASAVCHTAGALAALLAAQGRLDTLLEAVGWELLEDDNAFARALAAGETPGETLRLCAARDRTALYDAVCQLPEALQKWNGILGETVLPPMTPGRSPEGLSEPWGEEKALWTFHREHLCGPFCRHTAFCWRDGALTPVLHPDPIRLSDLKGYAAQRTAAVENTRAFLNGFEGNNLLLYGDRGTGKSSTVKALLNEFAAQGLRLIDMPKEALPQLPQLTAYLASLPVRCIVFVDDLSFQDNDDRFAALKAVLEGGVALRPRNVLIYATSNRRHLLRETFSDRAGDEVHHADTIQESISLSDRFGVCLTFLMPDKARFLEIVGQLADDRGLTGNRTLLLERAEAWAMEHGGRSPRFARQFIADAEAKAQPLGYR